MWGAANVIFVVDAQKLVPTLKAAHERIYQPSQLALAPLDEKADHVRGSPSGPLIIEYGDGGDGRAAGPVLGHARVAVPPAEGSRRWRPARIRPTLRATLASPPTPRIVNDRSLI